MQGHGYAQPVKQPPATGWLILVRVVLVVLSFCSFGLLSWAMLLRLAIVTRKSLDWGLFAATLAADTLSIVLIGSEPEDETGTAGWVGLSLLLCTLVAAMAYYLASEIRHYQGMHQAAYGARQVAGGYGYPQPPAPYPATVLHHTPPPIPTPPPAPVPQPPLSTAPPPPQRPAPARIDQVRAELDELSDYLRKHDGHHDGNHEGGR
jgi:hypothetical protein